MATKKSFLEMHEAVGGSYSSPERVQQEQEWNQKRQEKTAEINRRAVTQPKQTAQKPVSSDTSPGNQKKSTGSGKTKITAPTTGAVQEINALLFSAADRKQAIKKGQDPMFAYINSEVGRAKDEATKQIPAIEQTIKDLKKQKKPVGMDRTNVPYNEEIDSQITALQGQIDSTRQQAADMNQIALDFLPEEDKKALENYVNQRRTDWYDTLLQGTFGNGVIGTPGMRAEQQAAALAEKYGWDTVKSLAETLERQQNAEATARAQQEGAEIGQEHPVLGSAASIPLNVVSGAPAVFERIRGLGTSTGQYPTLDPNNAGNLLGTMGSSIQGQVASDIEGEDPNLLRKAGSYAYRGGMSALESGLRAATGKAGTVLLSGLGSFEQNVAKASAQGASPEKAVAMGLTNATIEALSEEIPLDNLLDAAKGGKQTFTQALKLALAQAGIEATTEEASLVGSTLAEAAILKDKSEFNQYIQSRIAEGVDPQTARDEAFRNLLDEAIDTAIVSAISGGGMSGVNSLITNYEAKKQPSTQPQQESTQAPGTPLQGEAADPRHLAQQQEMAWEAAQAMEQEQQSQAAQQEAPQAPPATDPMLEGIQTPVAPAQSPQQAALGSMLDGIDIPQDVAPEQTGPNPVADMLNPIQNPQQSAVDTPSTQNYNGNAITIPGAAVGSSGVTYTADNKPLSFQYAVVPAESLITSNDQFGNVNSAYPAELQPRDRTRAASQSQINNISRNLNPALLAESPTAQNGAPIIRGDGVVIGGNGRASAITQAYGAGRGADYQQFITQKAAELGIDPATIPANPVLVRVTNGVNNYAELANSLNAATTASYSATETAKIDASRIGDIIGHLSISENGGVNTAENREFIREFVSRVVPESERGDVMQANGQLSQAGERRIQNALFAYAYGDTALVERLAESTDNNAKNITNAMLSAAGKVAQLQAEIGRGEVQDLGLQQAITDAANLYLDAKAGKHTVEDAAGQLVLGGNGPESQYDGLTVNLAKFMESNSRSGLQIRTFIDILADVNMNMPAESASQFSLFGTSGPQTQEVLYNEAIAAYDQQRDGKGRIPEKSDFSQYRQYRPGELATGMDGSRPEGNPGPAAPDGGIPQAVQGTVPGGQRGVTDPNSPGIKGTGAAEANFTQKPAYNATLSADNAQPDRASDVRPMELPKTDINGNPVSAVTGNAYGSKITTDELASLMEEPTARGDFSYARITNDQATQTAMDTIAAAGDWESAYNQWAKDVGAGKAGAEMAARGALFLNHFAKEGNKTQWLNTLADMQDLGTNTAQGLQAMRLIRELAPQDKVRFVEMATKRLGQEMGVEFTIDQSLYDAYNSAETDDARNAALDDIQQAVADQIPSTALDKWNAFRYTSMLGNLKTNVRNIAGNIGAGAMYRVKDQVAATMEDVLYAATGGKFERTKSHTVSRELLNACKQDFDNVSGIVSDGGKYGSRDGFSDQFVQGAMEKRRIFKSDNKILNKVLAPMEAYRKGTNWMMNNQYFGDEAFGKAAYARSLAGYLKAHGVADTDLSKVDAALMDKARAYAVREAQEATFHDNSALARTLSKLKRATGVVGEGIIPFAKTPANVLTRAYEFSPLGLIDTTATAVAAAKGGGDVTGTDVINSLSKTLTGTAIFALGAWLKHQGFLTGGPDDDDEKDAFDKLNGDQNYAIRFTVGGKTYNYTFDWLTPAAMPLFMGAQLMDILDKGFENLTFADLENVFTSIADPMLQMSMLQSLNDSLDNIKYTDNNLGQFFINAAVSYLTQGLSNTLVGQIERSTEKNRMTTYVDKNSQLPAWMQRQIGSLSQKIPGWDYQQTEYRNAYGETEENEGGLLYNLLSPGYISEEKSTALSQELYRLNDAGVDGNVFPDTPDTTVSYTDSEGNSHKDYHLTAGEADRLKEVTGKTATTLLSDMIETDLYKAMSDQQKADAVRKVYDYARELGRTEAIDGYQGMDAWMEAAEKNPTKAILDRVVKSGFDDAFDSLTHAWEYDKDPASAVSSLENAYSVYSGMSKEEQKKFKENTGGKVGYFLDAKDAGIDGETFTELYKTYSDIDAQDSDASAKARNWAYYLNKEKAAGHITASQEETLKDSMAYYVIFPADAGKFNGLTEAGLSADSAQKVVGLMDGITGTGKDGTVRYIDKYKAIAGSSLSAKDKETAFLEYAPDAMDEKYNYAMKNMTKNGKGITIDDFVKAYQVTDEYSKKKEQTDAWQAMGYTAAEANNLYKLYDGKLT